MILSARFISIVAPFVALVPLVTFGQTPDGDNMHKSCSLTEPQWNDHPALLLCDDFDDGMINGSCP